MKIKSFALFLICLSLSSGAFAQSNPVQPSVRQSGAVVAGNIALWNGNQQIKDSGQTLGAIALGTSATATNPQRSGQASTGLYSDTAATVQVSVGGTTELAVVPGTVIVSGVGNIFAFDVSNGGNIFPSLYVDSTVAQFGTAAIGIGQYTNDAVSAKLWCNKNRALSNTYTIVQTNDNLCSVNFSGSDGVVYQLSSQINSFVDASPSAGIVPGRMVFSTTNTSGALTEAFRINNSQGIVFATARKGTFVCTGAGSITVANANVLVTSDILITMNAAGGSITTPPAMKSKSSGVNFIVLCGATDTSTYNYVILN